jgi:predicted CxxxxCH...CXXCH cytochrome family protein
MMNMKKQYINLVLTILALAFFLISCSDLKKDLPTAESSETKIHDVGWNDTSSINFHGRVLKSSNYDLKQCVTCHSTQFNGGTSGVRCDTCHSSYPHKSGWDSTAVAGYHGDYLRLNNWSTTGCTKCHGTALNGGTSGTSCYSCHSSYPHSVSWENASSSNHHGDYLKALQWQTTECAKCHGSDFNGGVSGKPCYRCHASYPHQAAWDSASSNSFHGSYLLQKNFQLAECRQCHGINYTGGATQISCLSCHPLYPHSTDWNNESSSASHGQFLKTQSWKNDLCTACHGTELSGGVSKTGCFTCHPQYPHSSTYATDHPSTLRTDANPLSNCRDCHGDNYTGSAVVNITCERSGCHVDGNGTPKSPESCNTCHGTFSAIASDTLSWAPPVSINGAADYTDLAVGAHQKHLGIVPLVYGQKLVCSECHTVPSTVSTAGHLGTPPAKVTLAGVLLKGPSTNGLAATFDAGSKTCLNTYCHGNWKASSSRPGAYTWGFADSIIVGSNYQPRWNGGPKEAACGTCHGNASTGNPLPTGHIVNNPFDNQPIVRTSCVFCHPTVVDVSGNIIDKTKHMNGMADILTYEKPMKIKFFNIKK